MPLETLSWQFQINGTFAKNADFSKTNAYVSIMRIPHKKLL